MSLLRSISIGALVLGAGCVALPGDDHEPTTSELEQAVFCAGWYCGDNSPTIATYPFHELNETGLENTDRIRITSFVKNHLRYELDVTNGRLTGRRGRTLIYGGDPANPNNLLGAWIGLRHTTPEGTVHDYVLEINAVGTAPYFADNNGALPNKQIETYHMLLTEVIGGQPTMDWINVCKNPTSDGIEALGMPGEHLVLFEGERMDRVTKDIQPVLDPDWFNIGCAGHALSKLYLSGHAHAAAADGYVTTIPERQTILRMFAADYCGTGQAFTVGGQPLQWMDDHTWMTYTSPPYVTPPTTFEARWTPNGASCLATPRLANLDEIADVCELPQCEGSMYDLAGHHLISANP